MQIQQYLLDYVHLFFETISNWTFKKGDIWYLNFKFENDIISRNKDNYNYKVRKISLNKSVLFSNNY